MRLVISSASILLLLSCATSGIQAQTHAQDLTRYMGSLFACGEGMPGDNSPCNRFVGMVLDHFFCIEDFGSGDSFVSANSYASTIGSKPGWVLLGELPATTRNGQLLAGTDLAAAQGILNTAQARANNGDAVIAVRAGSPHGHIALVIPGATQASGNWSPLRPPNAASMTYNKPTAASTFIGKALAYAWSEPRGIRLYAKPKMAGCPVPQP